MAGVELATAWVTIAPSAKGFSAALDRAIGGDLAKFGAKGGGDVSDGMGSALDSSARSGGLSKSFANVGKVFAAGMATAGVAAGAALVKGLSDAMGAQDATARLQAQLGTTAEDAGKYGKIAGDVYRQAWGDSLAEVTDTVAGLASTFGDSIPTDALKPLTVQAQALADTFDIDVTRAVSSAGILFSSGLVDSAQEGFDLIAAGLQEMPAGVRDELLEASDEYGTFFNQLGFDGAEAFGALTTAAEDGMYGIDKTGDAIKEFTIRSTDMSATSVAAFSAAGLNAEDMAGKFLAGGDTAREAFDTTVAAILAIEDPVERANTAIGLFGTPLEDLSTGEIPQFLDGLLGVEGGLAGVEGTAQEMADTVGGTASSTIESFKRQALGALADFVAAHVLPKLQQLIGWVQDNWPQISATAREFFTRVSEAWEEYGRPALEATQRIMGEVVAWVQENWPAISAKVGEVMETVRSVIESVTSIIQTIWENFGEQIWSWVSETWTNIQDFIGGVLDIISGIFETFAALFRGDWQGVWDGIKQIVAGVWDAIKAVISQALNTIQQWASVAWEIIRSAAKSAWEGIRDTIMTPVNAAKDAVIGAFQTTIDRVKQVWSGLTAVVSFFDTYIADPIRTAVDNVKHAVTNAFDLAVSGVKRVWDGLKAAVRDPINVMIRFVNDGIIGGWNWVARKVGLGEMGKIQELATGGWVPGTGNRDTVPAMLTPGEFVITKDAARMWGPQVLAQINDPRGTVDPAIFGYAAGGYVHDPEDALAWARQQVGKPYAPEFGHGPDRYDCSGFTSAIINYILGRNPYSRRHSSGTIGSDPAVAPGLGDNYPDGFALGSRPPYQTNSLGAFVGHIAGTLAGVNVESTPPAVRVGGAARGATSPTFTQQWHLPGYGGLSEDEKGIMSVVRAIRDLVVPSAGSSWIADLARQFFVDLPGKVFDALVTKLPAKIAEAVFDVAVKSTPLGAIGGLFGSDAATKGGGLMSKADGYANGGTVRRDGPIVVGEERPELMWARKGAYIQANTEAPKGWAGGGVRDGGVTLNVAGSILGEREFKQMIVREVETLEWRRRSAPRTGAVR